MKTVAIITARGGSKRIPRKNIKEFMGKPMISYAINAALDSKIFDEVMVSTEDKEITQVALDYGAKVPFLRSEKTANDYATTEDVLIEVIEKYDKLGKNFDEICCIYPCVPFLTSEILKKAYDKFKTSNANSLIPVVKYSFPIQRAFKINKYGHLEYREPENSQKRSQDLESMYHDVGMFYFSKTDSLMKYKNLVGEETTYLEMKETQIQDVDTLEDWELAELKYKIGKYEGKLK